MPRINFMVNLRVIFPPLLCYSTAGLGGLHGFRTARVTLPGIAVEVEDMGQVSKARETGPIPSVTTSASGLTRLSSLMSSRTVMIPPLLD
ncbi:MAG: hypothetical protein EBZ78_10975 [Verrucomicrobia bacterium]|nr:hypothetical protein [Verrucomicrobiota bacterium]